jgi:hypothetical protein
MIDSWSLMKNWKLVLPPSRPSVEQLQYLSSFAKNLNKTNAVAILGSTMEFRDLLYELGFENIYVFDRNEEFYKLTSKSRIYNNKEIFVHGNWVETIQNYKNKFSLILSDLTSGNVSYDYRSKFYMDIEQSLIDNGHFYDKVLTHDNFISVNSIFDKYKFLPINYITVNYFSCEMFFCSELLEETNRVETTKIYQQLNDLNNNLRIQKFIEHCKNITPEGFVWYYGKSWKELKSDYCKTLIKINELQDNETSPYFKRVRLFHLFKKDNEGI